jgi:hypothetical protein
MDQQTTDPQAHWEQQEPIPEPQEPRDRCTAAELLERQQAALELLSQGMGPALAAQILSERYGVSLRQARRYVRVAALELQEPFNSGERDQFMTLSLYRLDLIAGRAMAAGDDAMAIRATRAHAAVLAQFCKVLQPVGRQRITLRNSRTRPEMPF